MTKQTPENPTPNKAAETKYRIELSFDMIRNQLQMKSGCPTVLLRGILRKAQTATVTMLPDCGVSKRVLIEYDIETDKVELVSTDAIDVVKTGIIETALDAIGQNQLLQRLQAAKATSKLLLPGH